MKYFTTLLIILISSFNFAQEPFYTFNTLRGLVDSSWNTHLFYRMKFEKGDPINNSIGNSVWHLDINSGEDNMFLYEGGITNLVMSYYTGIEDYEFWNNDPAKFIYVEIGCGIDCGFSIIRFDNLNGNEVSGSFDPISKIFISNQNDSLLYSDYRSISKSTDGGWNWEEIDSLQHYRLLGINPFDDKILYLVKGDNVLNEWRDSLFTLRDGILSFSYLVKGKFKAIQKIFIDPDSSHIYLQVNNDDGNHLIVSDENAKPGSWNDVLLNSYSNECYQKLYGTNPPVQIQVSKTENGKIYLASTNEIYVSTNYGMSFTLEHTFNKTITGFYKPENSNHLVCRRLIPSL